MQRNRALGHSRIHSAHYPKSCSPAPLPVSVRRDKSPAAKLPKAKKRPLKEISEENAHLEEANKRLRSVLPTQTFPYVKAQYEVKLDQVELLAHLFEAVEGADQLPEFHTFTEPAAVPESGPRRRNKALKDSVRRLEGLLLGLRQELNRAGQVLDRLRCALGYIAMQRFSDHVWPKFHPKSVSFSALLAIYEEVGYAPRGLPASQRRRIKRSPAEETEVGEVCCICCEDFTVGCPTSRLDCGHLFHPKCIKEWVRHNAVCPLCITAVQFR